MSADLVTDAGCLQVAARLTDADRPVDVLVNNAGLGTYQRFGSADLADEERQLDLNVRAVMRLSHAAVRAMTARVPARSSTCRPWRRSCPVDTTSRTQRARPG